MKFYGFTKKNQEAYKQTTLLKWVRPGHEPSKALKNENHEEQAGLEETSQAEASGIQAARTSRTSNSSKKMTRHEPDLLAPGLASVLQGLNQPKSFEFPQKTFGNSKKKRLGHLPQMICPEKLSLVSHGTQTSA